MSSTPASQTAVEGNRMTIPLKNNRIATIVMSDFSKENFEEILRWVKFFKSRYNTNKHLK
jgi:hypothetical protein